MPLRRLVVAAAAAAAAARAGLAAEHAVQKVAREAADLPRGRASMQGCSLSDAQGCRLPYRPIVPSPRASLSPMAQCAAARLPCVRPNAPRAARPVARCAWHLRGGRCSVCTHSAHAHASCIMHHASCDGMSSLCSAPERARGSARLSRPGKRRCSPAGCAAVGATWTRWAAARSRVAGRAAVARRSSPDSLLVHVPVQVHRRGGRALLHPHLHAADACV